MRLKILRASLLKPLTSTHGITDKIFANTLNASDSEDALDDKWTGSLGARYSGTQYRTLNNSDSNSYTDPQRSYFADLKFDL